MRVRMRVLMLAVAMAAVPAAGLAQTDEIQVYDGGLAPVGTFNLTLHNNFTAKGLTTPAFPGAVTFRPSEAWENANRLIR